MLSEAAVDAFSGVVGRDLVSALRRACMSVPQSAPALLSSASRGDSSLRPEGRLWRWVVTRYHGDDRIMCPDLLSWIAKPMAAPPRRSR